MKKRISRRFMEIALFTIFITSLVMTIVFYTQLKKQVFSDLAVISNLLLDEESLETKTKDIRITLISEDGTVLYDSKVNAKTLTNHLDRPEIKEALFNGVGREVRKSDTVSESVFYYAKRLENGQVLRVGKEAHSVLSILFSTLPVVFLMVILLIVICLFVSHYLTAAIVKPIDRLVEDMDCTDELDIYPELIPFTRKIRTQHEEILSASNMRQEFTANVSHELKTPLTAISGYAELMEAGMVGDKDIRHFSGEIRKSAARLLTLINDIIKLSELDSFQAKESFEPVNLAEIAEESVEMLSISAAKNKVSISYQGEKKAEVLLLKELAQELAYNLIENAIRYNRPGGSVFVSVCVVQKSVVFTVKDTGIGIPKEHQERIFERFYRVDKSRSRELSGTGLGLAIVKHICSLADGKISLKSSPFEGTTISITFP